jgi:hypothetical protein
VSIHRLLHSSCYFLNTNTAIMWQVIQTAWTLEAEWWQFFTEVWVWGQRRWFKYWACVGCWISPCYDPFLLGTCFEIYELFISLIFQIFRSAVNHGYWIRGYGCPPIFSRVMGLAQNLSWNRYYSQKSDQVLCMSEIHSCTLDTVEVWMNFIEKLDWIWPQRGQLPLSVLTTMGS